MARVRQNQRTTSFCCFLQKIISQENTVDVKKNRVVIIEAEFYRLFRCLIRTTMSPASNLIFRACSIYAVLPDLRFHLMKTGRRSINKTSL